MSLLRTKTARLALAGVAVGVAILVAIVASGDRDEDTVAVVPTTTLDTSVVETTVAEPAVPSGADLRARFDASGGTDGLTIGEASGAFEVVSFDPNDPDRLIAAVRDGQGAADNSDTTELWTVANGAVEQQLLAPDVPHDFAHFNADGSITTWILAGDGTGYPVRSASITMADESVRASAGTFMSARSVTERGVVFAILHDGVPADGALVTQTVLVVDDGERTTTLDGAEEMVWLDAPSAGVVVVYPPEGGVTRVFDVDTLLEVADHPLAGREAARLGVSADESVVVEVDHDGVARVFDDAGPTGVEFGPIEVGTVDRPITVSPDGSIAVSVSQSGQVSVWSLGDGEPVVQWDTDAGPSRLIGDEISSRVTSVVAFDASRVALRNPARPSVGVTWTIVDLDVEAWG